jgi:putative addiction module component (TIGR02574 family)
MSKSGREVLDAALALPEADRALLAEALLDTLAPDHDATSDDAFEAELDRRFAESVRDPGATVSWSELRDEA